MLKCFILNIKHWFDRFINYYQFTFNLVEICLSRHFKVTFFFSLEVDKIKNKKGPEYSAMVKNLLTVTQHLTLIQSSSVTALLSL